ncbi:YjbQ family protein [Candidatus Curtissbacteria bacterium]|nr:YjbQ family protein [Candidatus Curtissbacteria bacterium]
MKAYLKEIKFPSTDHTYIRDITDEVNKAIKRAKVHEGFVFINTKHTTLGILVNEIAEPNLLADILHHTLNSIPEDRRSTRARGEYKHPTTDYKHRCQDNPYCDEIDEDYNAAAHIRALTFSHPSVVVPILGGKLELGKYQQVAAFEFDGRDGEGKNPIRQRIIQAWICPAEKITRV